MYRFPTPRDPWVGAWGAPNTPKFPPPPKNNLEIVRPPPIFFIFLRFKTPGRCFCDKKFQSLKTSSPPSHSPPSHPHPHAPAQPSEHSPQSWCNNKYSQQFLCEIWTTTTNTSNKYIKPAMSLYSLSINVHTMSNPQYN